MRLTPTQLRLLVVFFLLVADNTSFFRHLVQVYPLTAANGAFLISLVLGLGAFTFLFLTLISFGRLLRPVLAVLLIIAAAAAHFMDQYNVVIDHNMISNLVQTDLNEASDLFNLPLVLRVLLLGVLPDMK